MIYLKSESVTTDKFFEIDSFLDLEKQKKLLKYFLHPAFPWALTLDAVQGVGDDPKINDDSIVGMFHTFVYDGQICSSFYKDIEWILDDFQKLGFDKNKLLRIRAGLFFRHPSSDPHIAHVDAKTPHTTAVYYVNDCDGDLIIYDETYKSHPFKTPLVPTEIKRFQPSMGKLVVFDGQYYHSSSYPTKKSLRLAITLNFAN